MFKLAALIIVAIVAVIAWYFFPLFRDTTGKLVIYDHNQVAHFCEVNFVADCRYIPDPLIAPGTEHLTKVTTYETDPPTVYQNGYDYRIITGFLTQLPQFIFERQGNTRTHRLVIEWFSLKPDAIFGTATPLIFNIGYWLVTAGMLIVIFFGIALLGTPIDDRAARRRRYR